MASTPIAAARIDTLRSHPALAERRQQSEVRLDEVRAALGEIGMVRDHPLAIFCAGSLARLESGARSDLDLFVMAEGEQDEFRKRLFQITLFSELMQANERLGFPPFSNDGEYLQVYFVKDLMTGAGLPRDDSENLFTARMLLMLESQPLARDDVYQQHLRTILDLYYRDEKTGRPFRPIFLLNDLLRYWRTMCLNYEARRHDAERPFRKKNVNLKFSRMLTVFGTVLPLIAEPVDTAAKLEVLCAKTFLERLATGLDLLGDQDLADRWPGVLDLYADFLAWKERDDVEAFLRERTAEVDARAAQLSSFLYDALTHAGIREEFRRYLIL